MTFRNTIARRALENVQAYLGKFGVHKTHEYVESAFSYYGEIPFLYRTFEVTDTKEPDLKKEPGGFKVVSDLIPFSKGSAYSLADRSAVDFSGTKPSSRR